MFDVMQHACRRLMRSLCYRTYRVLWAFLDRGTNCRILSPLFSGRGAIVLFHRVLPEAQASKFRENRALEVSPEQLEQILLTFFDCGYEALSLDEMHERLTGETRSRKRFVSFTFDDGYRDVLYEALPIFERFDAPFALYLATCFPDKTIDLWWYFLEDLVLSCSFVEFTSGGELVCLKSDTWEEKQTAFTSIRNRVLNMTPSATAELLNDLGRRYRLDHREYRGKDALTWAELQQLGNSPLVTLAAHTQNHPVLSRLSRASVREEIEGGRNRLRHRLGCQAQHFAYPYGSGNEADSREFKIVQRLNFKTGVTTEHGNLTFWRAGRLMSLPRETCYHRDVRDLQCRVRRHVWGYDEVKRLSQRVLIET